MYGFLISLAILINVLGTSKIVSKEGKNPDVVWDLSFFLIISGIVGARLYHVVDYWSYYSKSLIKILYIWEGGLGIYGALIFSSVCSFLYLKIKNENILYYLSRVIIFLPLSQAIGRWGNFFNNELYGIQTKLPWGFSVNGKNLHPLFLYESLLNIILFLVLYKIHKKVVPVFLISTYFLGYGFIRFFLEFFRPDAWTVYSLNVAQVISIILILVSFFIIIKNKSTKEEPAK